jgi:hypothetical protein
MNRFTLKNCLLCSCVAAVLSVSVLADEKTVETASIAEGTVSKEEGLAAWARIYEVASHPRCANCHVGKDNLPMWSGPSYGETRPHGMNIDAGLSRIGAEYVLCSTCHVNSVATDRGNEEPHAAPRVATIWRLAPVEAEWFGKRSNDICNQLRDPARNGGRTYKNIARHLDHDVILHWEWNPGGNREAAPYSLQEHVDDILRWGVAGLPCDGD